MDGKAEKHFTKQISFYTSSEMVLNNLLSFMFFSIFNLLFK